MPFGFFTNLSGNGAENTGAFWFAFFLIYYYSGVFVKANVGAVLAANFFSQPDDNRINFIAFFQSGIWSDLSYGTGNNVANPGKTIAVFTVDAEHVNDFRAAVICYFNVGSDL